ncbi:MAG: acetylornithine deacetylase [bacterium]|nr:MAG: acetylornithine deacetylase [bacterium]
MEEKEHYHKALELLKALIQIPSFSGEENQTAELIAGWFEAFGIPVNRSNNNIRVTNKYFNDAKPSILLNSHHDTVKPNKAYTNDPFEPGIVNSKLFGLGSNDAGGCLVSLMALFVHFFDRKDLDYNLIFAATGEEESSGPNGLNSLLKKLPPIAFSIVGEPTGMHMAIAEKGLLVIDAYAPGKPGHAAHANTDNAIYNAMDDIHWIRNYKFPKVSERLGEVKMTVTQIDAGEQHNVVPASCHFVIDVRVNDYYTNREVFDLIDAHTKSKLTARSFRLNSSAIDVNHPIVQAGIKIGRKTYGSPTLSDQSVLSCPSLKMGPGDSKRSHQADEFICLNEIEEGIDLYIKLFNEFFKNNEQ